MRRIILLALLCTTIFAEDSTAVTAMKAKLQSVIAASSSLGDKVKAYATTNLLPLTTEPVWVAEVAAQNAKKVSLDEIKKIDAQWMKAEEELPIQKEKLGNTCAKACMVVVKRLPAIKELFVMDDQGANVGQSNLTSDYWQGDEEKWSNSYNGAKGGVDVGKVKFDKSANASIQQVSLPIIAADGTIIGAVCFGLDVGNL